MGSTVEGSRFVRRIAAALCALDSDGVLTSDVSPVFLDALARALARDERGYLSDGGSDPRLSSCLSRYEEFSRRLIAAASAPDTSAHRDAVDSLYLEYFDSDEASP